MKRDLWGRGGGQRGGTEGQEGDVAARVIRHFFLFLSRDTTGSRASSHRFGRQVLLFLPQAVMQLLGGSGGVVNSLDFCPASLKSLGCFYFHFFTMEGGDSEFVNFTLPTLKAFLEARSQNASGNKQ